MDNSASHLAARLQDRWDEGARRRFEPELEASTSSPMIRKVEALCSPRPLDALPRPRLRCPCCLTFARPRPVLTLRVP